jgi:addiction module HigA family antidote
MQTAIPIGPAANTPGEILRTEFLEPLGLSQNELAIRTGLDRMRISEIVRGRRAITAKTAIAFGAALDTGPQFWLNLQNDYDLAVEAKRSLGLAGSVSVNPKSHVKFSEVLAAIAEAVPKTAKRRRMPAIAYKRKAAKATGKHKGPSNFPESWAKPAGPRRAGKRSRK